MIKSILRKVMPKIILPWHILSGHLKGKKIVTSWYDYPAAILGRTEKQLLKWFADNVRPSETWIDVGAHYGYTSIALCSLVGEGGRVFAFEPMLKTVGHLSRTRIINGLNQLTILPFALSSKGDISIQNLPETRGMIDSTLLFATNNQKQFNAAQENILCTSFDWLWPMVANKNQSIAGIKIDVQGMELFVLQGMRETLKQLHPKLIVEFHEGVERNDVLEFLFEVGYSKNAIPIEPIDGEIAPLFNDNKSYFFKLK